MNPTWYKTPAVFVPGGEALRHRLNLCQEAKHSDTGCSESDERGKKHHGQTVCDVVEKTGILYCKVNENHHYYIKPYSANHKSFNVKLTIRKEMLTLQDKKNKTKDVTLVKILHANT
jgi:hypothetical protein